LYDYETDPNETRNLAPDQPDVVARLRARLTREPEAKPQLQRPPATTP
jgi:iduronate 2-sulfatase